MRRFNNSFQVDGYLAATPTTRTLPSGTMVANAHLGESAQYTNMADNRDQPPNWFPLSFYGPLAQKASGCGKGDHLLITKSRIEQRQFTPEGANRPRTIWEVIVDEFYVIARKAGGPIAGASAAAGPATATTSEADDWPVGMEQ